MNDKAHNWKIINEEQIEDFKIFSLKKSTRLNPRTNKPYTFLLMNGCDWVNIIALTEKKEVILVRQYRHGSECETLELPGGCVEKNEDPMQSAKRELEEETGYRVSKIEAIGTVFANPALQSIKLHCFVAYDAVETSFPKLDAGEDIKTIKMPLEKFYEEIKLGNVKHALIVAAMGLFTIKFPDFLQLQR